MNLTQDQIRKLESEPMERQFQISRRDIDEDARTIEVCFSSEAEIERWFGTEILDHSGNAVVLERINSGGAVLVNHDRDDQVGVVESARIDKDKKGRALLRFGESSRADDIWKDVKSGIRQNVSVQYRIWKYEVEEGKNGSPDVMRILEWEPLEISIVAIPADASVGVGRSQEEQPAPDAGVQKVEIDVNINHDNSERSMKDDDKVTDNKSGDDTPVEQRTQEESSVDKAAIHSQGAKAERERISTIQREADELNLEELGREAVTDDWSESDWRKRAMEEIGKRNNAVRAKQDPETGHDGDVDLSAKEQSKFSMFRLMEALAHPEEREVQRRAAFEFEVCEAAADGFGSEFQARGALIPETALRGLHAPQTLRSPTGERALAAGTATEAAELVATNLLSGSFIDVLRNSSAAMRAGMTVLPGLVGNAEVPRQTAGSSSTWISAEDGDATESEPSFDQVTLTPKDIAVYTEITRRALQQSTPSIEALVRADMAIAQALGIDSAVLYGSGASGQPTGISNQTGINTLDLAAADPTYIELVNMVAQVMAANAIDIGGAFSWLIEANGWEALSTTPKQASGVEGNFILNDDKVVGRPYIMSNQITDEQYFFGNFSQVLLGEWGGLDLIVDKTTHSLKGRVRFVMFKTADIAVRHPEAFVHAHDGIA